MHGAVTRGVRVSTCSFIFLVFIHVCSCFSSSAGVILVLYTLTNETAQLYQAHSFSFDFLLFFKGTKTVKPVNSHYQVSSAVTLFGNTF